MTANSRSPSVTHLAPSAGTSAAAQIFTRSLMLPAPARSFFRRTIVARIEAVSLRVNQAAALSAPHESMNHAFFLRDLKPNPVGVRFVPVAEEMIDMVGLAREDRVGEIAVGFKLDDALIGF